MDPNIAGMLFVLMIIAMVAGVILLLPITLRLGKVLESKLKRDEGHNDEYLPDAQQLRNAIRALQAEMEQLSERQAFTESLLGEREPRLLRDDKTP